jgi:hypothetical protein
MKSRTLRHDRRLIWATTVGILLLLPFLSTAFRIDEPNIIAIAEQIAAKPLDPYGFIINWNGIPEPAFQILANPPLLPAWLALWASIFGWGEVSLHSAVLPFAAVALLAFGLIARKAGHAPEFALFLLVASPAYFLSAQVVMPDGAMLAALLMSVAAGFPRSQPGEADVSDSWWFCLVALLAAFASPLLKYNAIVLVPIHLALFLLFRERRLLNAALAVMPLAGLAVWAGVSNSIYGDVHFLVISRFQAEGSTLVTSGLVGAFGLGVVPAAAILSLARMARKPGLAVALVAGFACAAIARWTTDYTAVSAVLYGVAGAVVALFLMGAARESTHKLYSHEWRIRIVLLWWVLLVLLFQYRLYFVSVRYLLPLLPPLLLLVLPFFDGNRKRKWVVVAMSMVLTYAIAIGDARIANTYRTFFTELSAAGLRPQTADGHWGFQYYAERAGAQIIDPREPLLLRAGEVHVNARVPFSTMKRPAAVSGYEIIVDRWYAQPHWPVRTIDCETAANFHGNVMKNCRHYLTTFLPYSFTAGYSDVFEIYQAADHEEPPAAARAPLNR